MNDLLSTLWLIPPCLLLLGSIALWRATRRFAALLQIVGSIVLLLFALDYVLFVCVYRYVDSPRVMQILAAGWMHVVRKIAIWLAAICFPLGFVFYALGDKRKPGATTTV